MQKDRMGMTHDDKLHNEKPTIQELYLDPLRSIIENNGGTVFKDHDIHLFLMVDLKSDNEQTYLALKDVFADYLDIIEWYKSDEKIHEPIQMLLTGGPQINLIQNEEDRYFYVDGAVEQWSMDYPVNLMPRVSTNYRNYFKW